MLEEYMHIALKYVWWHKKCWRWLFPFWKQPLSITIVAVRQINYTICLTTEKCYWKKSSFCYNETNRSSHTSLWSVQWEHIFILGVIMQLKKSKTYKEQVEILRNKGLKINDSGNVISLWKRGEKSCGFNVTNLYIVQQDR